MDTNDDTEPLIVNGLAVDPGLLDARPIRRCALGECQSHCCGGAFTFTPSKPPIF